MENRFKVDTKHTGKNLKEFILFMYRTQYPSVSRNFIFIGVLLIMVPLVKSFHVGSSMRMLMWIFGVPCLLMGLFRHYIALARTMNDDPAYRYGWRYSFRFTQKGIYIYKNDELETAVGGYNHVSALYEDEKNFYIKMDDEQVHILPKADFAEGDPAEFAAWIEEKSRVKKAWSPAEFGNKIKRMIKKQKIYSQKREEQFEERQREREERKRKRKEGQDQS